MTRERRVTYAVTILAVAMFYLMRKYAIAGPDAAMHESVDVDSGGIGEVLPVGAQD